MPGPRRRAVLGAAVLAGALAGPARADPCARFWYPVTGEFAATACAVDPPDDCRDPMAGVVQYCGPLP